MLLNCVGSKKINLHPGNYSNDSLKKYSYLIWKTEYRPIGGNKIERRIFNATGFFAKRGNKTFLVSVEHFFNIENPDAYVESSYIRL
jgi:hypothetical protein